LHYEIIYIYICKIKYKTMGHNSRLFLEERQRELDEERYFEGTEYYYSVSKKEKKQLIKPIKTKQNGNSKING